MKLKTLSILVIFILTSYTIQAQEIRGNLEQHKNQVLTLTGFNYYNTVALSKTTVDSLGNFSFTYPKTYKGMGVISNQAGQRLVLVLEGKIISINGKNLNDPDSILFTNSKENTLFTNISKQFLFNDKTYVGWDYLRKVYDLDHFKAQKKQRKQIAKALKYIEQENASTLKSLPQNSYISWYAPIRKLVTDMPQTVNNYPRRIPSNISTFRTTDLANPKFKTSGIFRDYIEGHYMLLENMGQPLDSVYAEMQVSTNYIVNNLKQNTPLLKDVAEHLFTYFEKRSLFPAAAYLSEQLVKNYPTLIDASLRSKMERYRSLKVGNVAPNIQLTATKTLKDTNKNILLVFGSGECGHCIEDIKKLINYYPKWKANYNLEVVYISIDTDTNVYNLAYKDAPWQTYCDFKGWDTLASKDYFVNATPTYFLLDKDLKILLHPRSLKHVDAWGKQNL